jgi:hypothetical protein
MYHYKNYNRSKKVWVLKGDYSSFDSLINKYYVKIHNTPSNNIPRVDVWIILQQLKNSVETFKFDPD